MLASMYVAYVLFVLGVSLSLLRHSAKALPSSTVELARRVVWVLLPPLALILIVLGSIFAGVATPTEAGALGACGAMLLAALNRRLTIRAVKESAEETSHLTAMVLFLLVGSTAFALVFRGLGGDLLIEDLLTGLPGGKIGMLIVANLTIFALGFFIDFFEIAFIILPLLVPAAIALDVDLVWFGVMIAMNLQTSFLTPPFGFSLLICVGLRLPVRARAIYKGVMPFIVIQVIALALICIFPGLVTR